MHLFDFICVAPFRNQSASIKGQIEVKFRNLPPSPCKILGGVDEIFK